MTGLDVLESHKGYDVTRLSAIEFDSIISTHFHNTADTFGLTGEGVEDGRSFREFTGVNTGESEGAILVVHDLECKGTEWSVRSNDGEIASLVSFWVNLRLRRNLSR